MGIILGECNAQQKCFEEKRKDLKKEIEQLKKENKLLVQIQDSKDEKIAELLDKIKELEKNITKPECINNTGCPSKQACVRYSCMIMYSG